VGLIATASGVQLIFDAQSLVPGNVSSLAGAALTVVIVQLKSDGTRVRATYSTATVGVGGTFVGVTYTPNTYASYITTGAEFPTAGNYEVQLLASFNAGAQIFKSQAALIFVDVAF